MLNVLLGTAIGGISGYAFGKNQKDKTEGSSTELPNITDNVEEIKAILKEHVRQTDITQELDVFISLFEKEKRTNTQLLAQLSSLNVDDAKYFPQNMVFSAAEIIAPKVRFEKGQDPSFFVADDGYMRATFCPSFPGTEIECVNGSGAGFTKGGANVQRDLPLLKDKWLYFGVNQALTPVIPSSRWTVDNPDEKAETYLFHMSRSFNPSEFFDSVEIRIGLGTTKALSDGFITVIPYRTNVFAVTISGQARAVNGYGLYFRSRFRDMTFPMESVSIIKSKVSTERALESTIAYSLYPGQAAYI